MMTTMTGCGLGFDALMLIMDADPDVRFLQQLHCNGRQPDKYPHPYRLTRISGDIFLCHTLSPENPRVGASLGWLLVE